jgi:succinoglycan biosynthesis transport protein ExoP
LRLREETICLTELKDDPNSRQDGLPQNRGRFHDPDDEVSLRELAIVPLKRKRTVMVLAALGLLVGILVTATMTPRYRATATIELNEEKNGGVSALSDLASVATGSGDELKVKIQTETAVIENDSIALAVMSKMGMLRLGKSGWLSKEKGSLVSVDALPARRREELIEGFEANLKVKEVENSRLIAITYASVDPFQAANVANAIVAEYRSYLLHSNYSSSQEVSQWLTSQLSGLSDQVTKTEQAVAEFERSHNLSSAMPGLATLGRSAAPSNSGPGGASSAGMRVPELDRLSTLNEEVTQAEAQRLADEAIYRLTETQNPEVISSLASSVLPGLSNSTVLSQGNGLEILNALREQEATARVAYADASTKYGAKNPRLAEIESQLKSLQDQIQTEMGKIKQRARNDLTLAEQNEKALQSAFASQKAVTSKMNDDVVRLGILMEQASSSRELYDLLFAKLQEANIDAGSSAVNVTIADPARPPGRPFVPRRTLFPLAGLAGGLVVGVGLAYLLESQDDTVADSFEVEALVHLPVLGLIPFHRREARAQPDGALAMESSPLLTDPEGATAESFRSLRSGLALSGVGRRLKTLAITSALGGEGKSYTVYNLGLAFAATGLKVLIVDADLRRPRQDSLFRVARGDGLSNLLAGLGTFEELVQAHSVSPNIFLLSAGQATPLASELLESGEIAKVLQAARERYDLVLVDNAPVLPVADPIQVASHCDGTIGVLRSGQTARKALLRFVQTVARSRIHLLGLVIGAVAMSASEYRSVYGYNVEKYYGAK